MSFNRFLMTYFPVASATGAVYGWYNVHTVPASRFQKTDSLLFKFFGSGVGFLLGPYLFPSVVVMEGLGVRYKMYVKGVPKNKLEGVHAIPILK